MALSCCDVEDPRLHGDSWLCDTLRVSCGPLFAVLAQNYRISSVSAMDLQ